MQGIEDGRKLAAEAASPVWENDGPEGRLRVLPPVEHVDQRFLPSIREFGFLIAAVFCLTPWASPPIALAAGAVFALTLENPFARQSRKVSKLLLQGCIVFLGFGMDLHTVLRAGAGGLVLAAGTIFTTLALGWLLGRILKIAPRTSMLISAGTAICGGSAIAAVGSVIGGLDAEMTVALGTVFILNAVALYLFPILGHALHLSQTQFGTWAGVAIHDISSVVAAAACYGLPALRVATAVKLSRALWIVPVSLVAATAFGSPAGRGGTAKGRLQVPWFIAFFLLASVVRSVIPAIAEAAPALTHMATLGLTMTLFLIGASLSRPTLRSVGWHPLLQGALLWLFISTASLLIILRTLA
jgi:uncharacterized integral membrane protein (TIGR00698 family)